MERKLSKMALKIAKEIESQYDDDSLKVSIYYGSPNARYSKRWWAFAMVSSGMHVSDPYGMSLRQAKTLAGLAEKEGCL